MHEDLNSIVEAIRRNTVAGRKESNSIATIIEKKGVDDSQVIRDWIAIIAIFVAVGTWLGTISLQDRIQQNNIVLESHKRYTELMYPAAAPPSSGSSPDPRAFSGRFWALQHVEFAMWRRKSIPDSTYEFWVRRRQNDFANNLDTPVSTILVPHSYENSWQSVADEYLETDFAKLIDELRATSSAMKKHEVLELLGKYKLPWYRRLGFRE